MAKVIENKNGRRQVRLSSADILSIVEEYQTLYNKLKNMNELKHFFDYFGLYLPEDM